MGHGKNAEKHNGKEWWARRPLSGVSVGGKYMKFWKRLLHKAERRQGKKEITDLTPPTTEPEG